MASPPLFERMVDSIGRALTPDGAREIVDLRADAETQRLIDDLADKCNEGSLTAEERAEYLEYISLFNVLTALQSRAWLVLCERAE